MPADPTKIALYSQDTFDVANPTPQQIDAMVAAAQDINRSGFGTVILGQWHVHSDGAIYYNNSLLDTVIQALKLIPTALKQGGSVKKVLITFGPFPADFQGIQQNLAQFKKTMAGVQAMTAIDGFDWDLEEEYAPFANLLTDLTKWTNSLGMMVTAAPYTDTSFWTSVLKKTRGSSPGDVQSDLKNLRSSAPGLDGGFIWKYESIAHAGYSTSQYATAIAAGLGGYGWRGGCDRQRKSRAITSDRSIPLATASRSDRVPGIGC